MIKFALKNISFLEKVAKVPVLKHFFILKISESFPEISSEEVLEKFYKDVYVSNKTSKKTQSGRFIDLDTITLDLVKKQENPIIHDIAVSNGISSYELNNKLGQENINCTYYLSDKYSRISVKKGLVTRAYSVENKLLFAYLGCFFAADKNIFFPFTVMLYKVLKKLRFRGNNDYDLLLMHPLVLKKLENEELNFLEYDIFQTLIQEKFTFVRVMNILNLGYFDKELIKKALRNISKSLKENGILLIGRTDSKNINNASFYRKRGEKFILLENVNHGTEIKELIEAL